LLSLAGFYLTFFCNDVLRAEPIIISANNTQHIQFKHITPTQYSFENGTLNAEVKNSASFLLLPFKNKKLVHAVTYDWKLNTGKLNITDASEETRRAGDDSVFKLGLMLAANTQSSLPFFAPNWLKQVRAALLFPSEMMIYIVADAKHAAGEHWVNPYNRRIEVIAAKSHKLDSGWSEASHVLKKPESVVGLWLMSDGDNTGSTFKVQIKNIRLE
jgi:hypothetical protein